jgi:hypothetical protein
LDGDSDLDLVVPHPFLGKVFMWKNNGDGTFPVVPDSYSAADGPTSVFCADLDGDTDPDLAVTSYNGYNVSVLKNNGDGTFQDEVRYGVRNGPASVFCADLDGDTDLDMAVANYNSGNVSVLINLTNTSSVQEGEEQREISSFHLSQNYPNPFNLSTNIEFTLAGPGFVTIDIFDILGRKVRRLVDEHFYSGRQSVVWNGKNDSGDEVASGIYFYRLRVGDLAETKKLVLLK